MTSPHPPVKDFFLIGKALKSHGTAGHMRMMIEDKHKVYLRPGSFVFFDLDGSKVPFKVASLEEGAHVLITLVDVDGKQESDKLGGKELWIPMEQVKTRHLNSPKNIKEQWEGYKIIDAKSERTFEVLRTEEYPQQLMAVILHEGKELLIPLHEQLITSIDRQEKIILMEIPDGLLEL